MKTTKQFGLVEKRLTHIPFKDAFTGSNPVQVTTRKSKLREIGAFFALFFQKISLKYLFYKHINNLSSISLSISFDNRFRLKYTNCVKYPGGIQYDKISFDTSW
jgi:hypothetical protein